MPSNAGKKVFKAKSILKPKPKSKNSKVEKNKENTFVNAQNPQVQRQFRKPKSLIPRPSGRITKAHLVENKERDRSFPTKIPSRKGSITSTSARPSKKEHVSKTEMLYQRARMALGKNKKPAAKPTETAKPPLQKRRSEAVQEVLKKQEKIRKNLDNRRSFCQTSSRNSKSSVQSKDRRSFRQSQEKINKQKLTYRKSQGSLNTVENDSKSNKPSKLSRKEARALIGLGDIPDEKIEEMVKVKKSKLRSNIPKDIPKPSNQPVPTFNYQKPNSGTRNEPRMTVAKSIELNKNTKKVVKETIKIKFPESISEKKLNMVKARIPECNYDPEMMSSINDFDEFEPVYQEHIKPSRKSDLKVKAKYSSKGRESAKNEENQIQLEQTEEEKFAEIEAKRELVRQQKKAKLKKLREEKEKERQQELKKKHNLEALNSKFKKRTENYKRKKAVEEINPNNDSL